MPTEIYRQSFETIVAEAQLSRFAVDERELVVRLIHACGMVDLAEDVVISPGAIKAGKNALDGSATVICDVEMVRRGIIARRLGAGNKLVCEVGSEAATHFADTHQTTRSAGGMAILREQIPGSIIAIGNAPTALFHLLEMLGEGLEPPALIIGCPVGFVGAVESKEALIEHAGDIPYITVRGRRGGSAIAAAAVNGLAGGLTS
ncbi:MAG: precorrin-8X methylmutase [Rhizobiaceae bacterium]|nr:precorrin-8X methylmutase [Rhizobiaceae bacterium]